MLRSVGLFGWLRFGGGGGGEKVDLYSYTYVRFNCFLILSVLFFFFFFIKGRRGGFLNKFVAGFLLLSCRCCR